MSVLREFLEFRADVNALGDNGARPLLNAAFAEDCRMDVVQALLDAGANVNGQNTPSTLKWRLLGGLARKLRWAGRANAMFAEMACWGGATALHFAAKRGDADLVELLLANRADPTLRNLLGQTPLQYADDVFRWGVPEVLANALVGSLAVARAARNVFGSQSPQTHQNAIRTENQTTLRVRSCL